MKHVFRNAHRVKQTVARDPHDPTRVYVETVTDDRDVLKRNERIRNDRLLKVGDRRSALGDDHAEVAVAFQFPTVMDYNLCKARHPELFAEFELGGDASVRAGERLALLEPEYVTSTRRGDRLSPTSGPKNVKQMMRNRPETT